MTTIYTVQQPKSYGIEVFSTLKAAKHYAECYNKPFIKNGEATKKNLYFVKEWRKGFYGHTPNGKIRDSKMYDMVHHEWNPDTGKWIRFNA